MSHHSRGRSAAAQFFDGGGGYEEEEDYGSQRSGGGGSIGGGRRSSASGGGGLSQQSSGGGSATGGRSRMDSSSASFEANDYQDEAEVAELLTKATVTSSEKTKLENLKRVKEIIINKQPALLDNFLNEMLDFQTDNNADVRCYILEFIDEACKQDPETIPKVLHNMILMLQDKSVTVQKKAIQVIAKVYRYTLMWLCKAKSVTEEMEAAWMSVNDLKKLILKMIDSDLDGIRTHTVKFIETVILLQTPSEHDSVKRQNDFSLDDVPITVKVARPRKLEEDARILFEELLKFHGSRHATSVNLMTCMGSIVIISKLRPSFMGRVVSAIEKLNAILPPTLERSQVTSVRKYMKVQLIGLLRHPRAVDFYDNITTLLTDLGATNSELYKAIPNWEEIRSERRKRQRAAERDHSSRKKPRLASIEQKVSEPVPVSVSAVLEDYDDDEDMEKGEEDSKIEDTMNDCEKSIIENLTPQKAAEIVFASMDRLPDVMPAHFTASFTPIAMAGTDSQIRHVARLLAAQITAYQLGPEAALRVGATLDSKLDDSEPTKIPTLVSGSTEGNKENKLNLLAPVVSIPSLGPRKKIVKSLKLSEITKALSPEEAQKQMMGAVRRILNSGEKLDEVKTRLISSIAVNSSFDVRYFIMSHIQSDIRTRLELGLNWIFAEYCLCQEFIPSGSSSNRNEKQSDRYEWTFFNLMKGILDSNAESEKSLLARKLYMEPPKIPGKGLDLLKVLCGQALHAENGMALLMDLAMKRPKKLHYLSVLLEFCSHAIDEVRNQAVSSVLKLYDKIDNMKGLTEDKAVHTYMTSLRLPNPPEILFTENLGRKEVQKEWTDDLVKASLTLYLQLLSIKNSLIHELAKVYVDTTPDVKRSILRNIELPVRKMGIDPPELMKLLDSFPKGAETLITRIIHILTDKTLPSAELVSRVRNLYAKRVSDVRFLIPVLNGLAKSEIIGALPKLIKLNPNVVKEVFNRLLGIHADAKTQHVSPITPVDLMVALHNIEPSKCDVKTVIKATSLCFNEADVFTAEVLAVVINQLLEQSPLPTLLMRTVIQTLALHAKLSGFIMNTLGRLVNKQVWTQPKVWEGFVKCCQRTIPKSIPILLTLPPPQLKQALDEAPDLRSPLAGHLMSFSQQQRSCLPPTLLSIVLGERAVKNEYNEGYDDYHGDVVAVGRVEGTGSSHHSSMKNEPRSPGREGDELSIEIKDEPSDYNRDRDD